MIVGPNLDGWKPKAADVHKVAQPWPRRIVEAHQITAVRLIPREFLPRVTRAPGRLVEIVVDPRILVALDEERVEAGAGARGPLRRQVDVAQKLAVVRIVYVHRPQQLEYGRGDLCEHVALDRGDVVEQARPEKIRVRVAVDRGIIVRRMKSGERAAER